MVNERWEHGSEFHWPLDLRGSLERSPHPWSEANSCFTGSGRDALRLAVQHGRAARGWQRLWLPSYLCQEVVDTAVATGLPCRLYSHGPERPTAIEPPPLKAGDALLVVNHFGLLCRPDWLDNLPNEVEVVEDHTHDPWSPWALQSTADFSFASLRKTLPVPEGGILWSPAGHELAPEPILSRDRHHAASVKRRGMNLKARYLAGELEVDKDSFRSLLTEGEARIASGPVSGITPETRILVDSFPVNTWRICRASNVRYLTKRLGERSDIQILAGEAATCPFSAILLLKERTRRDKLRDYLTASRVYTSVLWNLDSPVLPGIGEADRELSARILSVHCDGRYGADDLDQVAEYIEEGLGR